MSRINVANFRHPDGTDDNITLDSSGRVGIGSSTPGHLFHLRNASSPAIQIDDTTNNQFIASIASPNAFGNGSTVGQLYLRGASGIGFTGNNGSSTGMVLDSSGNLKFNSGYGSAATAYGCRAWINFDGTSGSIGTGRASGNISSVTDNGTGDYTLNFSNAMPDANYAAIGNATSAVGGVVGIAVIPDYPTATQTTTALRIQSTNTATSKFDAVNYSVAIFR